ncbi:FAD-binding oxidoreductase [Rhizobiaceae bacterium n13]|uniref:FAD-binding oxidoreductase n=1 Tax=Ferirhizobium litorale TaxID=2927786 RepID=A0AAE3U0T9_9HYPH|nr:FAD-binding oxidoreductase [Fererhizobium litorale]MDI7860774.1 FAD-binding oxidoreductase [Fererhizobium litorale]MDI7920922.1 FAD-binding oxidoreductase [Fererhizobium litorale]
MGIADTAGAAERQLSVDLLIVGGGIMGLWAAVHAERLGIDALLVDAGEPGQGASGGLLGALMPHMPDRWSDKKQFQFDALVSLENEIAALEAATGLSAGYRRCGRLVPLPKPHLRKIAQRHSQDAEVNWHVGDRRYRWNVLDVPPLSGWITPEAGEAGFVHDTLAARVSPRRYIAVLRAYLGSARHVRVAQNLAIGRIDPAAGLATCDNRSAIRFGHCIVAAGYRSFPLLDELTKPLAVSLGQPVKGQAALLRAEVDPELPVVFLDGLYIVPHEDGHVAIGSTSENSFADGFSTDDKLDDLLAKSRALVPALGGAAVVERWAGLRPKAIDRDPMVGPHPDHPNLVALTGGFKVSFGLAHRLAEAAIAFVAENRETPVLPASFTLESHIAAARRKG